MPAAVEVAAYRIAVEAVTNAVRHGAARTCGVRLGVDGSELRLEVEDDGTSGDGWVAGVGMAGMRERAEELGGTFAAGPQPAGGARVVATLPLPQDGATP